MVRNSKFRAHRQVPGFIKEESYFSYQTALNAPGIYCETVTGVELKTTLPNLFELCCTYLSRVVGSRHPTSVPPLQALLRTLLLDLDPRTQDRLPNSEAVVDDSFVLILSWALRIAVF